MRNIAITVHNRLTVYLPETQLQRIIELSEVTGASKSEIVRRLLASSLQK
ncbi:MAG: ribbon-helix-helix protein, CopG family [Acidobacteria bacterium]|nr:ribbon-helix-helix protein, CopG family [Acidobacteriota bacterium]